MTSWPEIFFFLWSLLSGVAVVWVLLRWRRYADYFKQIQPQSWPWGALDVLGAYLIISLASALAISWLQESPPSQLQLGRMLAEIGAIATLILYLGVRYGGRVVRTLLLTGPQSLGASRVKETLFAVLVGTLAIPLVLRIQVASSAFVSYSHPTLEGLKDQDDMLLIWGLALRAIIVAPILEELFYRGLLQGWLQRIHGSWQAPTLESLLVGVVGKPDEPANPTPPTDTAAVPSWPVWVSALFFAAAHLGLGASAVPLFFFGLVLGYLFRRTGSILACILVHMLLNSYSIALLLLGGG